MTTTRTNCHNVYVIEVLGGSDEKWISAKFVFKALDELKGAVQVLAWVPRS